MDASDLKVLEAKLESIARRIDDGFSGIDKRLDSMAQGASELETRIRHMEIHGSSESVRRMDLMDKRMAELDSRQDDMEMRLSAESIKLRWLVAIISGAITVIVELAGHFIK